MNLGLEDDMEELSMSSGGALNSAGGIGTSSASRARMLAQQRELQLKKRQTSASSGMVRSSIDKSENPSGFLSDNFQLPKPLNLWMSKHFRVYNWNKFNLL